MKLSTSCSYCKNDINFSSRKKDRVELARLKGEEVELSCKKCDHIDSYHVNKIYATENRLVLILASFIFLIGTPLAFYFIWDFLFQFSQIYVISGMIVITVFPFIIYSILEKEQRNRVKRFNSYRIRA